MNNTFLAFLKLECCIQSFGVENESQKILKTKCNIHLRKAGKFIGQNAELMKTKMMTTYK